MSTLVLLALSVAVGVVISADAPAPAAAASCAQERESNDQPPMASRIVGAGCVDGRINKPGDQDLFAWTVHADDAEKVGTFALSPAPG